MRFVGRGHPAIRATHAKTLELTPEPDVTERGTCVLAVGADAEPPSPIAGPVRIRLTAGAGRWSLEALANPSWDPAGSAVIRRGPLRLPGTFATDATAAAADLPRDLLAALQDPGTLVTVDVLPLPPAAPTLILAAADPLAAAASAALAAELERADEVLTEDADARRLAGPDRGGPGGRTLVVATRDLPGRRVLDRLSGSTVDTIGLPPPLAVAAACPSRAPVVVTSDPDDLGRVPAGHRLVLLLGRADLPRTLQRAADRRGGAATTVMQDHGRPLPATPDTIPELPGADMVACCLHPAVEPDALDPAVAAALDALLAEGTPTRAAARALAALTGWGRRRAYDAVLRRSR